jgi:Secretion system C-terminal sorting domain
MKNTIFLILILACCSVFGQQQPVSAGGEATGSGGSSSYSIGQIAQSYAIGANGSVAEGLQQPFEISTLGSNNFPNIVLEMTVYPNPTTNNITLKIGDFSIENLSYQMFDVAGKQILDSKISNNETLILLENQSSGIYFLNIQDNNKTLKTFKIIKN